MRTREEIISDIARDYPASSGNARIGFALAILAESMLDIRNLLAPLSEESIHRQSAKRSSSSS